MRRSSILALALCATLAPAVAADLPARATAPAPVFAQQPFSWTGFYVGVHAGWLRNETRVGSRGFAGFDAITPGQNAAFATSFANGFGRATRDGFMGGVQAGYNQQIDSFVVGVEADVSFPGAGRADAAVTGAAFAGPPLVPANFISVRSSSRLEWLGTLRLRGGFALDRLMIYGTGGLAFGGVDHRLSVNLIPAPFSGRAIHEGRGDEVRFGWTIGAGAEYAITNNLTFKGEYLYYDLGRTSVTATPTPLGVLFAGTSATASFENRGHIARAGLNYKF